MATTSTGIRYVIDTRASQLTAQAFASGLVSAVAHSPKIAIRDWEGEVQMTSGTFENTSMKIRINATNLEVLDELRDDDRKEIHRVMNQEVLESTRYPEILYESDKVSAEKLNNDLYRLDVAGQLTLHGVSNGLTFSSQVSMGVDSARAYGAFTLSQTDYNIRIVSIARGSLKLQDELKFSFYVVARKQ
jgi:polyisoprenoid-binding protein YceI